MNKVPLGIPKGTRDFSPEEMVRRKYVLNTIEKIFQRFGFMPIETPAMENQTTLSGKYGEEGDRLIFNILNSGDYLNQRSIASVIMYGVKSGNVIPGNSKKLTPFISKKALRYDLTVPFARYVVMHQNDITFPFRRYQIQPVWRADRPQKGRFREFYQCDVDVIGSNSLLNELELIQIVNEIFTFLRVPKFTIRINNRKILAGIAELLDASDKLKDITIVLDKLEKIGMDNVQKELAQAGLSAGTIKKICSLLNIAGLNEEKLKAVKQFISKSKIGKEGVEEMKQLFDFIRSVDILNANIEFDLSLARGLDYYTGTILEVKADDVDIGSIAGGGRYDDLTGIFGLPDVSGVGISFGVDRIFKVLHKLRLFPNAESLGVSTYVMFTNFGEKEEKYCLPLLEKIRGVGIPAEIYPEHDKLKKQMAYADEKNIPYVILVGSEEMESGKLTVKDMKSGKQDKLSIEEFIMNKLKK